MLSYDTGREPKKITLLVHQVRDQSCTGPGPRSDPPPGSGTPLRSDRPSVHRSRSSSESSLERKTEPRLPLLWSAISHRYPLGKIRERTPGRKWWRRPYPAVDRPEGIRIKQGAYPTGCRIRSETGTGLTGRDGKDFHASPSLIRFIARVSE